MLTTYKRLEKELFLSKKSQMQLCIAKNYRKITWSYVVVVVAENDVDAVCKIFEGFCKMFGSMVMVDSCIQIQESKSTLVMYECYTHLTKWVI